MRINFKKILIVISLSIHISCSNYPVHIDNLNKIDPSRVASFSGYPSFAFKYNGDDYYFTTEEATDGSYKCNYLVGVKNNTFFASFNNLKPLEKIYNRDDLSVSEKKNLTLKTILELNEESKSCPKPSVKSNNFDVLVGDLIIVPLIAGALPLAMIVDIYSGAHGIRDSVADFNATSSKSKVRLGQNLELVTNNLSKYFEIKLQTINGVEYFVITRKEDKNKSAVYVRSIYFFENKVLTAMVENTMSVTSK